MFCVLTESFLYVHYLTILKLKRNHSKLFTYVKVFVEKIFCNFFLFYYFRGSIDFGKTSRAVNVSKLIIEITNKTNLIITFTKSPFVISEY